MVEVRDGFEFIGRIKSKSQIDPTIEGQWTSKGIERDTPTMK